MRMLTSWVMTVALIMAVVLPLEAQRGMGRGMGGDTLHRSQADMDRRIQERMGQVLKAQLRLSDAQVRQMHEHNQRFGPRRMSLGRDERLVREQMREAMRVQDSVGAPELPRLLDRVVELQRRRVDLLQEEQRALAAFLTPLQRARYLAFEEEVQRRAEEMRREWERSGGRGGPPGRDTTGPGRRGGN
jgi:hypothetical protein